MDFRFIERMRCSAEVTVVFVPFYEVEGLTILKSVQTKYRESIRTRFVGGDSSSRRWIGVSRQIDPDSVRQDTRIQPHHFHSSGQAVTGLRWGVEAITPAPEYTLRIARFADMQLRGTVLTPTLDRAVFERQCDLTGSRDTTTTRDDIYRIRKTIYYPVWRIVTVYRGTVFESFVCAATGRFLQGAGPQSARSRATAFSLCFASIAFLTSGCIVLTSFLWHIARPDIHTVADSLNVGIILMTLPLLIMVTVMSALAAYGWDRFRYQPEIVITPTGTMVHAVGKLSDSWLDRLHEKTLEAVSSRLESVIRESG
ncbi:hypothetical protein JXA80_13750, partial [bacterium]|nr:hypothetical protein [candidate division CSSED10-310 bacterium]